MESDPAIGTAVVLVCDGDELARWPLQDARRPDLALVDHLARVRLTARRLGCTIELRHAGAELLELLELVGLDEVLGGGGGQVLGQAEGGEQAGVEEAVPGGDPPA